MNTLDLNPPEAKVSNQVSSDRSPSGRGIFVLSGDEPIILLDPGLLCRHLHSTSYIIISRQAAATWQPPIEQPPVTWHPRQHRSTTPDYQSTTLVYGGDRRSMVAVNGGCRWRTTVDHHRTIDQRWLIGRVRSGHGPGLVGSWAGLGRVMGRAWIKSWAGSGSGRLRGMPRVSHVCPHDIYVDVDVDINNYTEV
nr:hypothetical protein [Tanacetum cinerariifolium]